MRINSVETSTDSSSSEHPTTLDGLRAFVHQRLCAKENLLEDQFGMQESPILRGDQTCGLQFLLQGPRAVRLSAVWTSDRNEIFLYDAGGERYAKIELQHRISA